MVIAICNVQEFNPIIGGVERVSLSLATELLSRGIEVLFISCRKSIYSDQYLLPAPQFILPDPKDYAICNKDTMITILKEQRVNILLNQNAHSILFHKLCREVCKITGVKLYSVLHFCPDMRLKQYKDCIDFHFFSFNEILYNCLFSLLLKPPFTIITMHDIRQLYRELYKDSDKVILLSKRYFDSFSKLANLKENTKLVAIPNMLSFQYEKRRYQKENTILFCGRLTNQKRPYRVLYVWKLLQDNNPNWSLDIIGDGPWLNTLKKLSSKLKLKRVKYYGFVNPIDYYKKSKIMLMTSNFEGWPLTLIEAMQFGCIPIAFDSFESLNDIITDGFNGYTIPSFNIKAMANKVQEIIKCNTFDMLSTNALESVAYLTPKEIGNMWINILSNKSK